MLTKLKKTVQSWITFEAKMMDKAGLTPNIVTGLGVLLGAASGIGYWAAGTASSSAGSTNDAYRIYLVSATLLLLASGFCDALDGAIARLHGKTSVFGGFLDSLLDRYVEAFVYFGLILGGLCNVLWGLLALVGSLLTSYARARAEAAGVPMESIGIIERAERLLVIAASSLLSLVWLESLNWSIIILAFGANLTVVQRVIHFYRETGSKKE